MNPSIESFTTRGLALKAEVTEGSDSTPTSLLNAFQIMEGTSKIVADAIARNPDRPYFNSRRSRYTNFRGQINGQIEIVPPEAPGTDPLGVGLALEICGMAKTLTAPDVGPPVVKGKNVYNPISRLIPSATGYWWHAGTFRKITGMRGNLSGLAMEIGKMFSAQLALEGRLLSFSEADLPTDFDFDAFLEPTPYTTESGLLTIDDFAVNGKLLSVDFGNQLKTIEHTEARIGRIGSKDSKFKCRFYRTALADFDPYAKWKAGDIIEMKSVNVEDGGGRQSVMTVLGQITGLDEPNQDNDYAWEISGDACAVDGNDEVLLSFEEV